MGVQCISSPLSHREALFCYFCFLKLHLQKFALTVKLHVQVILLTRQTRSCELAAPSRLCLRLPVTIGRFNVPKERKEGKKGKKEGDKLGKENKKVSYFSKLLRLHRDDSNMPNDA